MIPDNIADLYFTGREPIPFWGMNNRLSAEIDGLEYWFAAPEYVILKKLEYYKEGKSEKHIRDIKTMFALSGGDIDINSIKQQASSVGLTEFLKEIL